MEIKCSQSLRTLRKFMLALAVATTAVLSCVPSGQQKKSSSTPEQDVKIVGEARRADVPAVMVFLPQTKDTAKLWAGLHDELIDDFDVVPYIMKAETTAAEMSQALTSTKPACVVLVNNPTVRLFAQVQEAAGGNTPPAVIVMTSYVQEVAAALKNVTGIAYEVPAVTSFVNVRNLVPGKVERVGVLRRAAFAKYLAKQREIAAQEKFEIIDVVVSDKPTVEEVSKALELLRDGQKVDAVWVLNDNALLQQELIANAWINALSVRPMPVIVGVPALVSKEFHFGSFAVLPDHTALGVQAAGVVFELADEDWDASQFGMSLPLSVESLVDVQYARDTFGFREENVTSVDRIVE